MNTYNLLFDLDRTLVNTDFIYLDVWKELLNIYNISVNKEFFNYYILLYKWNLIQIIH